MQIGFIEGKSLPYVALILLVINHVMSPVLVQGTYKAENLVYFVSKVFKGIKARYQKFGKLSLVIVAVRKLRPYFQNYKIFVKTKYLVCQVLKNPNSTGRMVA